MNRYQFRIDAEAEETPDGWKLHLRVKRDTMGPGKYEQFTTTIPAQPGAWPSPEEAARALWVACASLPEPEVAPEVRAAVGEA